MKWAPYQNGQRCAMHLPKAGSERTSEERARVPQLLPAPNSVWEESSNVCAEMDYSANQIITFELTLGNSTVQ